MDFIHDQLTTGRKICVLTVVDTFSRYAPVIDPRFSDRGEDVVATLEKACAALCTPHPVRWLGDLDSNQDCPSQSREFYR